MQLRKALSCEKDSIYRLYQSVKGTPFCAWDEEYPGQREIESDLACGNLFVLDDGGSIAGTISINAENELDGYDGWKIRKNAGEFARVAVKPELQGRGLSIILVNGIIAELKRRGKSAVHISVAKQNLPALRLYRRAGFDFTGEHFMYGSDFYLCEMVTEADS